MDIASVRILRLAFGTSASLWVSQAAAWDMSFIAPVITMFILALPLPVPKLKGGIAFVAALVLSMYAGTLLLPSLLNYPGVGLLLLIVALYWSFYFTARGGSAVLGTFVTVGIGLSTAVGSVSIDATLALITGLGVNTVIGVLFVWIAHAVLPDSSAKAPEGDATTAPPEKPEPNLDEARWSAFRSLLIVFPVALFFMLSASSAAYVPVIIKVASMGQQATFTGARTAGRSLIMSSLIGGAGAIIGWQVLSIVPTLSVYTLVIALAALIMGPRIFQGRGMHPQGATWSYGFLTMIVILAPAVMDSAGGDAAGIKFWQRLVMFALATLYAYLAIVIVDAWRPKDRARAATANA